MDQSEVSALPAGFEIFPKETSEHLYIFSSQVDVDFL